MNSPQEERPGSDAERQLQVEKALKLQDIMLGVGTVVISLVLGLVLGAVTGILAVIVLGGLAVALSRLSAKAVAGAQAPTDQRDDRS